MKTTTGYRQKLAVLVVLLIIPGCLGSNRSVPEKNLYSLEVSREGPRSSPLSDISLRIHRFASTPRFESREFVYRIDEFQYESDYYHKWFIPPSAMLTQQVHNWMGTSGLFQHVLENSSIMNETHILEGSIIALYGDYRERTAPKAVMELRVRLIHDNAHRPDILFEQDYRQALTIPDESPGALIKAWNEELHQILTSLEADLRGSGAIAKPRP